MLDQKKTAPPIAPSRVGKNAVIIPAGVEVSVKADAIDVKGPLGQMSLPLTDLVEVRHEANQLICVMREISMRGKAMSGTFRALLNNLVQGVSKGFERRLTLVGVGYRAQAAGDVLNLTLGFSHPIAYKMPAGVKVATPTPNEVIVSGFDKQMVCQAAAEIRAYRRPEPYKGKGVRYSNEVVKIKETKKK